MSFSRIFKCGVIFGHEFTKQSFIFHNICNANKLLSIRYFFARKSNHTVSSESHPRIKTVRNYVAALGILTLGASFAAVPLYRIFCQASGFGGTVKHDLGGDKIENMEKKPYRKITVRFESDVSSNLKWQFRPQQKKIVVIPGETSLAFYTAVNPLDEPIIGISTYNVLPYGAASYFNKIQCFCFEEQQLNPKEQVDMPVFFYIDPEFCEDPMMENIDEITLSYTFFKAKESAFSLKK